MRVQGTGRRVGWRRPIGMTALLAATALVPVTATTAPAVAQTGDACGTVLAKADGGSWSCSFVDNFDSFRGLDTKKWVVGNTSANGLMLGPTCYVPGQGVDVSRGQLKLTVTRKAPFQCQTPAGPVTATYTGGAVSTWGKFAQAYGRFEVRMKFPSQNTAGFHGGFWMNPKTLTYGGWPASGEIDIAEWFSSVADHMYPTLHYTGSTSDDTGWNCVIGAADVFHTYALEWSASKMDFIYDGQTCFSRSWAPTGMTAPAPFDQPFVLALLTGIGVGSDAPLSSMPTTSVTYVDYVKAWT